MSSLREVLPPPSGKLIQVHVNLNSDLKEMLDDLAIENDLKRTEVLRALIIQEHLKTFE